MAQYQHLRLLRLPEQLERRKRRGFGTAHSRNRQEHKTNLERQLAAAVDAQQRRRRPGVIDPALILRVQLVGPLQEEDWANLGLTVVSSDLDRTLVLFSSSDELTEFRRRLDAYAAAIPAGQRNPAYAQFVSSIESIGAVEPRDRLGIRLREAGVDDPAEAFTGDRVLVLDVELWDFGSRQLREQKLAEIEALVAAGNGQVLDRYVGASLTMLRVRVRGGIARELLSIEEVATVDLPPLPDVTTEAQLDLALGDLPPVIDAAENLPLIGIIDSGLNAHPLLENIVAGSVGIPPELGDADDHGHGTRVAGVAVFGDLRAQLGAGTLVRAARVCSAKVVNARGGFDETRLVPSQMRDALTYLNAEYGCRIFVLALGDVRAPYAGGKVGAWAATLDELARDLNVLIIVSAGNRVPRRGGEIEQAVTEYPHYLLEDDNHVLEPASAANVISVGALSHGPGLDADRQEHLHIRPITRVQGEPSPFTRVGPGVQGTTKPDLADFGGTYIYDPLVARLLGGAEVPSAGVITLHHLPINQLFTTGSGTSYAAPLVAWKAAQLLTALPNASANLLRALLCGSAKVPEAARERLAGTIGEEQIRCVCGYGRPDVQHAMYSDDARVVLFVEDQLAPDYLAVYEVPIPPILQTTRGRRTVRVTLAFDPPVRHSRIDYAGLRMNFRLIRGCTPEQVFEHFRRRGEAEGPAPEMADRYNCKLDPSPQLRDKHTVQSASRTYQQAIDAYGDRYLLVVRCEAGWAADRVAFQRFALVVELAHEAEIQLYQQLRVRVRA